MYSFLTDTACKFQYHLKPSTLLSAYLPQYGNIGILHETMQLVAFAVCSGDHCNTELGYTNPRLKFVWWHLIFPAQLLQSLFPTHKKCINPYPTAFPYGNGMVLHFYQQQESSTTKTVHKVINKGLKTYV